MLLNFDYEHEAVQFYNAGNINEARYAKIIKSSKFAARCVQMGAGFFGEVFKVLASGKPSEELIADLHSKAAQQLQIASDYASQAAQAYANSDIEEGERLESLAKAASDAADELSKRRQALEK